MKHKYLILLIYSFLTLKTNTAHIFLHKEEPLRKIVRELLKKNRQLEENRQLLKQQLDDAIKNGNLGIVQRIIEEKSIDLNQLRQYPFLYRATYYRHIKIVKHLLAARAEVNQPDHEGNSPLLIAINSDLRKDNSFSISILLLKNGAHPLQANNAGMTACQIYQDYLKRRASNGCDAALKLLADPAKAVADDDASVRKQPRIEDQ